MKRVTAIILSLILVFTFAGADVFALGTAAGNDPGAATGVSADGSAGVEGAEASDPAADPAGTPAMDADPGAETDADVYAAPGAEPDTDTYAAPGTEPAADPSQPEAGPEPPAVAADEDTISDIPLEAASASKLSKPRKLRASAGFKSVMLKWSSVKGADGYIILRTVAGKGKFSKMGTTRKCSFTCPVSKIYTDYAFRVIAYKNDDGKTIKSAPAKIRQNAIRRLRIYVTFKIDKKYSNGDKIHSGTTVMSDSFGGGNYLFRYKGRTHSIARIAVRNISGKYKSHGDYSSYEAEMFASKYVRKNHVPAKKKYLIWVSTYTQHLYVLKKVRKNKWNAIGDWEISTGAIDTPTTTTGKYKKIYKKKPSNDGIQYWNYFSPGNALHGCNSGMIPYFGQPASHGCVRNPTERAHWIYNNCGIGTPVIMY